MTTLRQAELGVDLFTGVVVASVAVALAGLTWHVVAPANESAAPTASARQSVATMVDVTPALKAAPFGIAVATMASDDSSSDQPLRLHGIVFANPATASSALIGSGDGDPRAYRAGETLPSGAVLRAIALDHVTLDISGSAETLGFPKPQASGSDDQSSSDDDGDSGGVDAIRALIPASAGGGATGKTDVSTAAKPRDRIDDNPRSFLDSLGATAAAGGYRIGASPSADLRTAGLMSGDVIERVNGVAVGDPAKDRALFDQAVAAGNARVTVRRDGRSYTFSFPIR